MTTKTQRRIRTAFKIAKPIATVFSIASFFIPLIVWCLTENRLGTVIATAFGMFLMYFFSCIVEIANRIK